MKRRKSKKKKPEIMPPVPKFPPDPAPPRQDPPEEEIGRAIRDVLGGLAGLSSERKKFVMRVVAAFYGFYGESV